MTYAGARRETGSQMASVLHFPHEQQQVPSDFALLIKELNGEGAPRGYQLRVANALWGQKGYQFLEDYKKLLKDNYSAELNEVDLVAAPVEASRAINEWVKKETLGKIKEIIKPETLGPMARLVLTNAIYFKGNWERQFKKDQTLDTPFLVTKDQKVTIPMMNQTARFGYWDAGSFQVLELPYVAKELSMIVFLPKEVDGLAQFEKSVTVEKLIGWLGKLHSQEVIVSLPRFKVTAEFQLKSVLVEMGMPLAFDSQAADFSGMNGESGLFLSFVAHKAYVDVNEEGTEAAAATGVGVILASAPVHPVFRADHPFFFVIKHNRSGSILFLGRVTNPQK
jgi:serpin B